MKSLNIVDFFWSSQLKTGKVSFMEDSDLQEFLTRLNLSSLCDQSGLEVFTETLTVIFTDKHEEYVRRAL